MSVLILKGMNLHVYSSHPHEKNQKQIDANCVYCKIDSVWGYTIQSIRSTPDNTNRYIVMCLNKHTTVLTKREIMNGCPICVFRDPTIHSGASYVTRADNLLRKTCPDCNQVYFSKYGTARLGCDVGHAILSDYQMVRVNVIAALEAVLGQTADDWFFHYDTDMQACAMGYKVAAFIGTAEEYLKTLSHKGIVPSSTEFSLEKIIDPRMPLNKPYTWLVVRIDPGIAHMFVACVNRFIEATNLHHWLQENRNQDIQSRIDAYEKTGKMFSLQTRRPTFPKPISLRVRQ